MVPGAGTSPPSTRRWRTEEECGQMPVIQGPPFCCGLALVPCGDAVLIPALPPPLQVPPSQVKGGLRQKGPYEVESRVPSSQVRQLKPSMGTCLRPQVTSSGFSLLRLGTSD
ncbi:hypothetical protein VULLAG_LOCUS8264 [Vulpes lagopus]